MEVVNARVNSTVGGAELALLNPEVSRHAIALAESLELFGPETEIAGARLIRYDYVLDSNLEIVGTVSAVIEPADGSAAVLTFNMTAEGGLELSAVDMFFCRSTYAA